MINYKLIMYVTMAIASYHYLEAMEMSSGDISQSSDETPRIIINNETKWELEVQYALPLYGTSDRPFEARIHANDKFTIPQDPASFDNLIVIPYGEKWQHAQLTKPKNLMSDVQKLMENNPNSSIEITIHQTKALASWLEGRGGFAALVKKFVGPVEQIVTPFAFSLRAIPIQEKPEEPIQPAETTRFLVREAFPGVVTALEAGKPLQARYYLDIPQGASLDSIDKAYISLKNEWQKKLENKRVSQEHADIIKRVLDIAYHALIAQYKLEEVNEIIRTEKK